MLGRRLALLGRRGALLGRRGALLGRRGAAFDGSKGALTPVVVQHHLLILDVAHDGGMDYFNVQASRSFAGVTIVVDGSFLWICVLLLLIAVLSECSFIISFSFNHFARFALLILPVVRHLCPPRAQ